MAPKRADWAAVALCLNQQAKGKGMSSRKDIRAKIADLRDERSADPGALESRCKARDAERATGVAADPRDEYVVSVDDLFASRNRRWILRDVADNGRVYTIVDKRRGPRDGPGVPLALMIPIGGTTIPTDADGCVTWTVS